jgi:hypothetical protein
MFQNNDFDLYGDKSNEDKEVTEVNLTSGNL